MKVIEQFASGAANLSFEIFPPKHDTSLADITQTLDALAALEPDFISVTFGAGGSANNNRTIELSRMIVDKYGIECVVHLTCLCYSKDEIDDFLCRLADNGLFNILALRGDRREGVAEKTDFPHASDLIKYIKNSHRGDFCVAAACYPDIHPEAKSRKNDIEAALLKERCGAQYFISQLFFDNKAYIRFEEELRAAGVKAPICAGIMPVINKNQIERMVSLCGAVFPERFQRLVNKYGDDKEAMMDAGITYAKGQIIDLCAMGHEHIHLYTMNNPTVARRIAEGVKRIMRGHHGVLRKKDGLQ